MPREIECYFPYDGTYIDATIHDYTSKWRFSVAWKHTELRETIQPENIPADEASLRRMAINRYEKHRWQHLLENMDTDLPAA